MLSHPVLAENSLFKLIGEIFHPLFELFGLILAGLYAIWPNYGFAITGLTIIIMLALTPVTVKSTKSMLAMQRLQPEMKKLQAKYKGPENRELLNQEMMRLYKENGTSPFGACLPSLLQMPFLIVLYTLIRALVYGDQGSDIYECGGAYRMYRKDMLRRLGTSRRISNVPQLGRQSRPNALVVRDGFVVASVLASRRSRMASQSQAVLIIPYLVLIAGCDVPAVLPNEADE